MCMLASEISTRCQSVPQFTSCRCRLQLIGLGSAGLGGSATSWVDIRKSTLASRCHTRSSSVEASATQVSPTHRASGPQHLPSAPIGQAPGSTRALAGAGGPAAQPPSSSRVIYGVYSSCRVELSFFGQTLGQQKYSRQNISGAKFMKAFEFGLGIFFLFPSPPPPPCPGLGWGEEIESDVEVGINFSFSPSPNPLWPEGQWNQWPLCVHTAQKAVWLRPGLSLPCEHRGSADLGCPLTPGSGVIVCRGSLGPGGP